MEDERLLQAEGFRVLRSLGQGEYGRVYLIYNASIGVLTAKIINQDNFNNEGWKIIGDILKGGQNPFLIQYFGGKKIDSAGVFIVLMEFANAG
ncbi:MAG: hypothetical protein EZS28_034456, partial [Streblomastix strix]